MEQTTSPEAGSIWRDVVTGEAYIVRSHMDEVAIGKNPDGTLFPYGRSHFISLTPSNGIAVSCGLEEFRKRFLEQLAPGVGSVVADEREG